MRSAFLAVLDTVKSKTFKSFFILPHYNYFYNTCSFFGFREQLIPWDTPCLFFELVILFIYISNVIPLPSFPSTSPRNRSSSREIRKWYFSYKCVWLIFLQGNNWRGGWGTSILKHALNCWHDLCHWLVTRAKIKSVHSKTACIFWLSTRIVVPRGRLKQTHTFLISLLGTCVVFLYY